MSDSVLSVSVRELLDQALNYMKSKPSHQVKTEKPFDADGMEVITSVDCPYPMLMVVGKKYQPWVLKHAHYCAVKRSRQVAFVCFDDKPLYYLIGLLALSAGISHRSLYSFQVPPRLFGTLNDAFGELYDTNLVFHERMDFEDFPRFARSLKETGVEVIIIDALHSITIGEKPVTRMRRLYISSALQEVAHAYQMTIVAGCKYDDRFPSYFGDSVLHCDP
jgi:hypothetical protein